MLISTQYTIHPNFLKEGMFEGGRLDFLGNLMVPGLKNHDVIAEDIIEKALRRNRGVIKRPKSLQRSLFFEKYSAKFRFLWFVENYGD